MHNQDEIKEFSRLLDLLAIGRNISNQGNLDPKMVQIACTLASTDLSGLSQNRDLLRRQIAQRQSIRRFAGIGSRPQRKFSMLAAFSMGFATMIALAYVSLVILMPLAQHTGQDPSVAGSPGGTTTLNALLAAVKRLASPTVVVSPTPTMPGVTPTPLPAWTSTPPPADTSQPPAPSTPTATPEPVIVRFEAVEQQDRIPPGSPVTLSWEIAGGNDTLAVTICGYDSNQWQRDCQHDLPKKGTTAFTMVSDGFWMEFSIEVSGVTGVNVPRVRVHQTCHNEWFFADPPPPWACPNVPTIPIPTLAQPFEGGWMFLQVSTVTIFYGDGVYWAIWSVPDASGHLAGITPPDGRYLPDPALSAVWLGEVNGAQDARDRLGWALGPAGIYQGYAEQCEFNPPGERAGYCYQLSPGGSVYQYTYQFVGTSESGYRDGVWQTYPLDH